MSVKACPGDRQGKVGFQTDRSRRPDRRRREGYRRFCAGFMCNTSAPTSAGCMMPIWALRVGAVRVNLSAVFMDDAADVADAFLHAVGGRVSNHDGGQSVAVLLGFGFQSSMLTFPCSSVSTTTTFKPSIAAVAGLVPWADLGIGQMLRVSPRRWLLDSGGWRACHCIRPARRSWAGRKSRQSR